MSKVVEIPTKNAFPVFSRFTYCLINYFKIVSLIASENPLNTLDLPLVNFIEIQMFDSIKIKFGNISQNS